MPLLDALRSKPVDWRMVLSRKINGLGVLAKSPTREKWRICWVFSRARVGGIINDFGSAFAENPMIITGLTATRPGRPIGEKGAVIAISSAKRLFYGARTVSKPGVIEALFRGSVNFRFRDEFARDCPLQGRVDCEPEFLSPP